MDSDNAPQAVLPELVVMDTSELKDSSGEEMRCQSCGYFGPGNIWKSELGHPHCDPCLMREFHKRECPCSLTAVTCNGCMKTMEFHPKIRLYLAMVNGSTFKCIYQNFGCSAVVKGLEYGRHTALCEFRPVPIGPPAVAARLTQIFYTVKHAPEEEAEKDLEEKKKLPFVQWFPEDQQNEKYFTKRVN